ncbi:hypothetical protein [Streptomyces albidoflavus]|uniref:hypothetical protein n=1 Tax=Streptomyces albidoflavus TaxID=1886 RepID=UPI001A90E74F|nr:hypothetical protein [Streptomyces albidoflavus]
MSEMAVAAARAGVQAARLAQSVGNPYVMVKHGRREDRAAVYDRFIAACAGVFHEPVLDREGTTELLVALMAIELRAPRHVRDAATELFGDLVGPCGLDVKWWYAHEVACEPDEEAGQGGAERGVAEGAGRAEPFTRSQIRSSEQFLAALGRFARIARRDVTARWWHPVVKPWSAPWWPFGKGRGQRTRTSAIVPLSSSEGHR